MDSKLLNAPTLLRTVAWVRLLAILVVTILGCAPPPADAGSAREPGTVILVSIDGFRPDYLERFELPNLRGLAAEGVHAPAGMIPVFPTLTFPSHYSIVTGLYPEHHGIVANRFHDPEWDAWFSYRDRSAVADGRWWGGEPIWVTAQRQGLRCATYFWVGSEAPVRGVQPTYWKEYDGSVPSAERVDQALRWLDLPETQRPSLITLYFGEVDSKAHRFGPVSKQVGEAARRVDVHLGRLLLGLERRDLSERVNLVVVSDHGMSATSDERVIALDDYIDLADVRILHLSPLLMLQPRPGKLKSVRDALKDAHPHLAVYGREEVPERLHFRDHRRIAPLVGLADDGWTIVSGGRREPRPVPLGTHGFDNAFVSMRALFVARGPAFRNGVEIEPFESIHLYELLAGLLGVEPAPNDGNPEVLSAVLREEP